MKKTLRYTRNTLLILIGLPALYAISYFLLSNITIEEEKNAPAEMEMYIKTNGVHTDLVLPIKSEEIDWSKEIKFDHTISKDSNYQYVAIGWGDKGFYLETPQWADLKFSVAFKAAFGLSTTAIHTTFYKNLQEGESCKKLKISKNQYARLIQYIRNSLQKDTNGHFINIQTKANYNKFDAFYEANGSYSLLHTCNTWANNGLKSCGQKCCFWTPFDKGIFSKY